MSTNSKTIVSQAEAKANFDFCNVTVDLKSEIEHKFLELGQRLYEIRETEKFRPNYDTFEEFCLELKMSGATISKLINIFYKFLFLYKIPIESVADAGGWSNVAEILPLVESRGSAKKWLHLASTLSRGDLRKEIREKNTGIVESKCKHKDTYGLRICRSCGLRERLYENESKEK